MTQEYITRTEAKKILRGITDQELLAMPGAMHYKGLWGDVVKVPRSEVEKLAATWKPPESYIREQQRLKNERQMFERARREASFLCELCGEKVKPQSDSTAVLSFLQGRLSLEECRRLVKGAHMRHKHTDYDMLIGAAAEKRYNEIQKERREGMYYDGSDVKYEIQQVRKKILRGLKL